MRCRAWALLVALLPSMASLAAPAEAPLYAIDFERARLGRLDPRGPLGQRESAGLRVRSLIRDRDAPYSATCYAEVAAGIGPDKSRALRLVDRSDGQTVYGEFHSPAPAILRGVIRFDIYFEQLPTRGAHPFGRRNFLWNYQLAPTGRITSARPNRGFEQPDYLEPMRRFREGQWYNVRIQYDARAIRGSDRGAFSVFVKSYGPRPFRRSDAIIENGPYRHDGNDSWGRLMQPRHYDNLNRAAWRLDNFRIFGPKAAHTPTPERRRIAFSNPAYIIVPEKPDGNEVRAANDVVNYLYESAGLRVRRIRGKPALPIPEDAPRIHIGATDEALDIVGNRLKKEELPDAFALCVRGNTLAILGKRPLSTRWACEEFLERCTGVRWYLPRAFGTHVPRLAAVDVPAFNDVFRPSFLFRKGSRLRAPRMRQRAPIRFHHNIGRIFDPKKYVDKFPDLYPYIKGRRLRPAESFVGWQPCLSHPKAVDIAVEYAREQFLKGATSISLGVNDGWGWCQCFECARLYAKPRKGAIGQGDHHAAYFLGFANKVARRIGREFPGKLIGYLGYSGTLGAPPGLKIEPNLAPFLVQKSMDLNEDGVVNLGRWKRGEVWPRLKKWRELIAAFGERFSMFCMYDWYYGSGRKVAPNMCFDAVRHYVRYAHSQGCKGVYVECYPNYGLDGHKYYFYFKLLWDVTYDDVRGRKRFYHDFFRAAAWPMRDYFEFCERLTFVDGAGLVTVSPYSPKKVRELRKLLDDARRRVAQDSLALQRVNYFAAAFEVTALLGMEWHAATRSRELMEEDAPLVDVAKALANVSGLDLDRHYRYVLDLDPEQFRRPNANRFAPYQDALKQFAEFAEMAAQELADERQLPLPEAKALLRARVAHALPDPDRAAGVLARISP